MKYDTTKQNLHLFQSVLPIYRHFLNYTASKQSRTDKKGWSSGWGGRGGGEREIRASVILRSVNGCSVKTLPHLGHPKLFLRDLQVNLEAHLSNFFISSSITSIKAINTISCVRFNSRHPKRVIVESVWRMDLTHDKTHGLIQQEVLFVIFSEIK